MIYFLRMKTYKEVQNLSGGEAHSNDCLPPYTLSTNPLPSSITTSSWQHSRRQGKQTSRVASHVCVSRTGKIKILDVWGLQGAKRFEALVVLFW